MNKKRLRWTFATVVFVFIFCSLAQAGQLNVLSYGAVGDGISDDTTAIQNTITQAYYSNDDVYFPPGTYLITADIQSRDGVSLYGDYEGLSVIIANGQACKIGDSDWSTNIDNITIQDLHFLNVRIKHRGTNKRYHNVTRCIFMGNDPAFDGVESLNWQHVQDGILSNCIFLRQGNCRDTGAINTYKTKQCTIEGNIWGLDLNNTTWLSQWDGYNSWFGLLDKLQNLRQQFNLDWDQGQFRCAYYPNRVIDEKIHDNIFNGSPFDDQANNDHVVYTKDYTNLEVVGNWMRGWPVSPGGGLKMRNAYGPAIVAANHFVNTPVLQYAYDATTVPEVYHNVLLYRNWFDINEGLDFNRLGLSYWETAEPDGDDVNIEYDHNTYNCDPCIGNINICNGNTSEHEIYPTNYYAGTSTLIPIESQGTPPGYTSGSPDSARTSPFENYPIPFYDIPTYASRCSDYAGDINCSGEVDDEDLRILSEQWLGSSGYLSADIAPWPDLDGRVNLLDFAVLLRDWLRQ